MGLVTIPFDYAQLSPARQSSIIPICIARDDDEGRPIAWEWFEAIARIPDRMLGLARFYLDDVWRASELAEGALHRIWKLHGCDFGRKPERRLSACAAWLARDLRAGSWRERRGVVTTLESLDEAVRQHLLADPRQYEREYQHRLDLEALSKHLAEKGMEDVSLMLDLVRDGCSWEEVGERLGKTPDAARMRFHRKTSRMLRPRRCEHLDGREGSGG